MNIKNHFSSVKASSKLLGLFGIEHEIPQVLGNRCVLDAQQLHLEDTVHNH